LIYAFIGAVIGGAVAVALINRQWDGKLAYIYRSLGIKQPCSDLILQVSTRLLARQLILKSH
jgi:hypothetical protein